MEAAARAFIHSRVTSLSPQPHQLPPPPLSIRCRPSETVVRCAKSGVDGSGVFDDFVLSTPKSDLDRGFSVIANMLRKIEPLDTSAISKGVSDSSTDSMKQTISTMLGLPFDHFSVTIRVSNKFQTPSRLSPRLFNHFRAYSVERGVPDFVDEKF